MISVRGVGGSAYACPNYGLGVSRVVPLFSEYRVYKSKQNAMVGDWRVIGRSAQSEKPFSWPSLAIRSTKSLRPGSRFSGSGPAEESGN